MLQNLSASLEMKGLGYMKYVLLSRMYYIASRRTSEQNLNEWWAEKHQMKLKKQDKISPERTFFNYEEGCLGLPYRNLANPCSLYLVKWELPGKPVFPALFSQVHRHKRTENRETAAPQDILQMLGTEAEATNSALVSAVVSNTVSVVHAEQRGFGKARGSGGSLVGKKRFPSQSNGNEEKLMADAEILQSSDPKRQKEM